MRRRSTCLSLAELVTSDETVKRQRGQPPTIIETALLLYIIAHIWQETRELWEKGLVLYFHNMWNIIDFIRNSLYVVTIGLRILAYFQAQAEISENPMSVYIPREEWNAYDPMLIADGLFAAGNIFAALKLLHIFSINPYLGPLQISLGRMVLDIIKFFFIYALVLFAFACGLNQLLWYYADMERQQCFSGPGNTENWTQQRDSCLAWRRFSNLFESSQTLFWASFGLVDISNFELIGIKSYTRFWGLLMFGSYSVINVVVLLNLLIAMMSNSYNVISERADVEWKFARTTLFMNYFEKGGTVPPPFNIFPTLKHLIKLLGRKSSFQDMSFRKKENRMKERDSAYQGVMCNLVWRYVTAQQKDTESHPVTEDNINELRQDVYTFRHDLMRVLKSNGMNTRDIEKDRVDVTGKRIQIRKRRLIKDFSIGLMEVCTDEAAPEIASNKGMLARLVGLSSNENRSSQRWRDLIQAAKKSKIIGNRDSESGRFGSIKRQQDIALQEQEQSVQENVKKIPCETQECDKNSKNNLYPKLQEHDIQCSGMNSTQPSTDRSEKGKQNLSGLILKPDSLMKDAKYSSQKLKEVKYAAPQPKDQYRTELTMVDNKNMINNTIPAISKTIENTHLSRIDSKTTHIPSMNEKNHETTITLTSSPEKSAPQETAVQIIQAQPENTELIDFEENKDTCLGNTKGVYVYHFDTQKNVKLDHLDAKSSDSDAKTDCFKNGLQTQEKEDVATTLSERKGWL